MKFRPRPLGILQNVLLQFDLAVSLACSSVRSFGTLYLAGKGVEHNDHILPTSAELPHFRAKGVGQIHEGVLSDVVLSTSGQENNRHRVCVCVCVCVCVRERERERERERGNFAGYRGNPATFFENTGTRFLVPFWAPKFSDSRNSAKFRGCSEIVRFLVPDPLVFS